MSGSSITASLLFEPSKKTLASSSAIGAERKIFLGGMEVSADRSVMLAFLFPRLELEEERISGGVSDGSISIAENKKPTKLIKTRSKDRFTYVKYSKLNR